MGDWSAIVYCLYVDVGEGRAGRRKGKDELALSGGGMEMENEAEDIGYRKGNMGKRTVGGGGARPPQWKRISPWSS